MQNIRHLLMTIMVIILGTLPIQSHAIALSFDTDIMLLLTGPVSEATQETVLLIRRGDNFISKDSLSISCVAGATAGLIVGLAPTLGFVDAVTAAPISGTYLLGTMLLSCAMSIVGSATGMGTAWVLHKWHNWRDTPAEPLPAVDAKPVSKAASESVISNKNITTSPPQSPP